MSLYCPYCDSSDVRLKETLRISQLDPDEIGDRMIEIRRVVCSECGEVSYAFRIFRSDDSYDCVRRDQLETRTGIRIKSPFGKPKRRWSV